ncbi:aminotransferase class I/II-fold pyridoxal phosphate-dependent enzyme [Peribacillus saganii]|uniref:Aminotransferase class I/II-fold pyridoxal phosphate-dependent enzyme n=1 Tax=Peribacillus saganii TaxID=2303992 RepID=A0A372LPZ1_9BACI|nr:pyridoxal phosphate-dependent aminotransferase [Peribacillus saganii]RFU70279.1 aminotransferase class I/II-fold pyridoxal phosphate-dependent enzyme [Peribacillus saganii]
MNLLEKKFLKLGAENAPGQEVRQNTNEIRIRGEKISGTPVDFSHGDVDAFEPIPGSLDVFIEGVHLGGKQAYTEYRGSKIIREDVARKLENFTGTTIDAEQNLIITPGTQGALFLAMGSTIVRGDKVAIVVPDYFANHKLVEYFDGEVVPIQMDYFKTTAGAGLDLTQLEDAFKAGVKLFLFSNPNNPTGVIYSSVEIKGIAKLAQQYGVTVIADELYSRQIFDGRTYTHLCAQNFLDPENVITIMGPSKTESLSGYRLGVAFGSAKIIDRMEKLQAIVSLRAGGYSQAVMKSWFAEPEGWMTKRIAQHQAIRNDLIAKLKDADGFKVRATEAGSYLFPRIQGLDVSILEFTKILRLQADVIVTPGTEFGPQFTDSFRINFSQDHKAAVAAIDRVIKVVELYRK